MRKTPQQGASAPAPAPAPSAAVGGNVSASTAGVDSAGTAGKFINGSSTLPSLIQIGDKDVQLGTVVAAAHKASGLSTQDWDALSEARRDELLNAQIEAMRTQAAEDAAAADRARAQEESRRQAEEDERLEAEAAEARRLDAAARAQREEQEREEAAARAVEERERLEAAGFPAKVRILNHSPVNLTEPESGAFIQAGGFFDVTVQNPDHGQRLMDNLRAVLDQNYLDHGVLDFEPLSQ